MNGSGQDQSVLSVDHRDVLLKAASIVEEGWCQGHMYRNAQGVATQVETEAVESCALGAIRRAMSQLVGDWRMVDRSVFLAAGELSDDTCDAVEACLPNDWGLADWNDYPGRKKEEVANLLREAASR